MIKEKEQVIIFIPKNKEENIFAQEMSFKYEYRWGSSNHIHDLNDSYKLLFFRNNNSIKCGSGDILSIINYCKNHNHTFKVVKDIGELKKEIINIKYINYNEPKKLIYE